MLYREIIAVCSEIRTKHINTLCEQNVEFVVHIVTTEFWRTKKTRIIAIYFVLIVHAFC
jgi:hypothetical protein